jgi:geranylgeranyl diphosphate synthase type II
MARAMPGFDFSGGFVYLVFFAGAPRARRRRERLPTMAFDTESYLREQKALVDETLDELLPPEDARPQVIHRAMRYSVFAGGKRIRPTLAMAAAKAVGGKEEVLLRPACALECIHTYSLIHDDLPALDDDDLRRGKPSCHKQFQFGEANAILAGSALLTLAFQILSTCPPGNEHAAARARAVEEISKAIGAAGMIAGQAVDLEMQDREFTEEEILYIHLNKTGALMAASLKLGGILSGAEEEALAALEVTGKKLGLCFQIVDDILNVEGDAQALGKATGSDASARKATYPALFGILQSQKQAKALTDEALDAMKDWGEDAEPLRELTRFLLARSS